MRILALLLGSAALAIAPFAASAKSVTERGDAQLALLIGSRTAGTPVKCINIVSARPDALQVIDGMGVSFCGRSADTRSARPKTGAWCRCRLLLVAALVARLAKQLAVLLLRHALATLLDH